MLTASSPKQTSDKVEWVNVPVTLGDRSFDEEKEAELHEIFQHGCEQLRYHTAEWQQTVTHMRENFVKLHPVDADQPSATTHAGDVVIDTEKIRTLFFEYPPAAPGDVHTPAATSVERPLPTRYQVRFDVSDCASTSVTVTAQLSSIVVRATSTSSGQCCDARVMPVPPGVQREQLRAFLSADGILTVEAPLVNGDQLDAPPTSVDEQTAGESRWKRAKTALAVIGGKTSDSTEEQRSEKNRTADDAEDGEGKEMNESTEATDGQAGAPSKEKVGVPIFRDELGTRRMYLAVELGTIYRPRDVIIQVYHCFITVFAARRHCVRRRLAYYNDVDVCQVYYCVCHVALLCLND